MPTQIPDNAGSTFLALFLRSYSRRNTDGTRETWTQAIDRCFSGLIKLGNYSPRQKELMFAAMISMECLPSGRWMWIGGTPWVERKENYIGSYNCASTNVDRQEVFGLMMSMAMMGTGTGAVLEERYISQLPRIKRLLDITVVGEFGKHMFPKDETDIVVMSDGSLKMTIGDSRDGWCKAYQSVIDLAMQPIDVNADYASIRLTVDISGVRPKGKKLKGFGGIANPNALPGLFPRMQEILNGCAERGGRLNAVECCILIDEAAKVVVAGNVRRCLAEGTMVSMSDGTLKDIAQVVKGDMVSTPEGPRRVTDWMDQGLQTCLLITTDSGKSVMATANHRFAVMTDGFDHEWLKVGLLPEKEIILQNGVGTVKSVELAGAHQTYDIEVDEVHCFYADGFLSHNSAGMRQGGSDDEAFACAKDNLWAADENGVWKIDPKRDALRMANHTRVFHHYPTPDQIHAAVTKQFYSGEGAIQFAPEAIARGNADLLNTENRKRTFVDKYADNNAKGLEYLHSLGVKESEALKEHRESRYGLNPCFVPGTLIMTREGHFPIESLVGKNVEVHDGDRWVEIDNFRITGRDKEVFTVTLHDGSRVTATANHKFVLTNGTKVQLSELKPGDKLTPNSINIHGVNVGEGSYLKGFLIGDGTVRNGMTALDVYEPKWMCEGELVSSAAEIPRRIQVGARLRNGHLMADVGLGNVTGGRRPLRGLSAFDLNDWVTINRLKFPLEVMNWDYPSKLKFIAGYMDADGTGAKNSNGFMYQVTSVHEDWLRGFQRLLKTVDVQSTLRQCKKGGYRDFAPDKGGICLTQPLYRLTISQGGAKTLAQQCVFNRLPSFALEPITYNLQPRWNKVASIEFSHVAPLVYCCTVPGSHNVAISEASIVTGQCAEVLGSDFLCNLSEIHLKTLHPLDLEKQIESFKVGGWITAALLHHTFENPKQQYSREVDPIVGVSFTGLFDFFVNAFGLEWLKWWEEGRTMNFTRPVSQVNAFMKQFPQAWIILFFQQHQGIYTLGELFYFLERQYLSMWQKAATAAVWEYCDDNNLKRPNRCTVVQPAGSKSLLTGSSPGWHPPKGAHYIRRITYAAHEPLALALIDLGFKVIPGQTDKDENGALLEDPFDPRCTEWLLEFPVETSAGQVAGAENIDFNKFSAVAQLNFYMQVQNFYATHTTSATIELREEEITEFSLSLWDYIGNGFMSAALLPRYDSPFPRLPFEVISKEQYLKEAQEVAHRCIITPTEFNECLNQYDNPDVELKGPAQCDSAFCLSSK